MMQGVLLVNLGSPNSPSVADVRRYLREFLMDGRVLDVNWFVRFCVVHFAILPSRPQKTAEAYRKIWMPAGSPLIVISRNLQAKLQQRVNVPVELAMRYQEPAIPDALRRLAEKGVDDLLLIPLFPHYAMSSYESAVERVKAVAAESATSANPIRPAVTVWRPGIAVRRPVPRTPLAIARSASERLPRSSPGPACPKKNIRSPFSRAWAVILGLNRTRITNFPGWLGRESRNSW